MHLSWLIEQAPALCVSSRIRQVKVQRPAVKTEHGDACWKLFYLHYDFFFFPPEAFIWLPLKEARSRPAWRPLSLGEISNLP